MTTTELANAQAKFANDQGSQSAYVVVDPGLAYFTEQQDRFKVAFNGSIAGTDTVDSLGGQSDFGSTISKIQNAEPEIVQTLMIFPAVGTFIKQLRSAGLDTPVLGNVTSQTRELPPLVGKGRANDIFYTAQVYFEGAGRDPETDSEIVEVHRRLRSKLRELPRAGQRARLLPDVASPSTRRCRRTAGRREIGAADAIREQEDVAVPGGTLVRFQDGYAIWNPILDAIQDGEFEQVEQYDAGTAGSSDKGGRGQHHRGFRA